MFLSIGEWCVFISNKVAVYAGHVIFNVINLHITNVSIKRFAHPYINIIQSEKAILTLNNITIHMLRPSSSEEDRFFQGVFLSSSSGITISEGFYFICPVNYFAQVKRHKVNPSDKPYKYSLLVVQCKSCLRGTYNINNDSQSVTGNLSAHKRSCFKCPTGGICIGNIKASDNCWGHKPQQIVLPSFHTQVATAAINKLMHVLLIRLVHVVGREPCVGPVTQGLGLTFLITLVLKKLESVITSYSFSVLHYIRCVIYYFLDVSTIKGYFKLIFLPLKIVKTYFQMIVSCLAVVKNHLKRIHKQNDDDHNDDNDDDDVSNSTVEDRKDEALLISALLKIIVNFFQIAALLHVDQIKQINRNESNMNEIGETISKVLNFRFVMYREICPMTDLNLPLREFGFTVQFFSKLICVLYLLQKFQTAMVSYI